MKSFAVTAICLAGLLASPTAFARDFCAKTSDELANLYKNLWQNSGYVASNEREFKRYSEAFERRLNDTLSNKNSLTCSFKTLREQGISSHRSDDGRIQVVSWDTGTGGTMHEHRRAVQYVDDKGAVHVLEDDAPFALGLTTLSIPTKQGQSPVYALHGLSVGSTALYGQSVELLQIDGNSLTEPALIATPDGLESSIGIAYNQFTLPENGDGVLIDIDGKNNEIRLAVIAEETEEDRYLGGQVTDKKDVYRFDGKVFHLVK